MSTNLLIVPAFIRKQKREAAERRVSEFLAKIPRNEKFRQRMNELLITHGYRIYIIRKHINAN